ncbi:hypothetical protein BDM02DRAFT_3263911 [Thelephora ganbajun]|uniref:Uncharacterized protein n=1 Tax=Thelephora ganbajun TaxID=370292 RepID=A0ACB6Z2L2_THEGA|nr:hypothetical protein BDM02DRAFT_3263911 [Thelephora ganbajun]
MALARDWGHQNLVDHFRPCMWSLKAKNAALLKHIEILEDMICHCSLSVSKGSPVAGGFHVLVADDWVSTDAQEGELEMDAEGEWVVKGEEMYQPTSPNPLLDADPLVSHWIWVYWARNKLLEHPKDCTMTHVRPSDGWMIVLPDFLGNRFMSSLGNIEVLTTVTTTSYTFVRDALPLRQDPNVPIVRSLYSPPVKFLVEKTSPASNHYFEDTHMLLTKINLLSQDLTMFRFEIQGAAVEIAPGQNIALDFTDFTFELTMREKPGGVITGTLFTIARKLKESMPHVMEDSRVLGMTVRLVGVAGDFVLPPIQDSAVRKKLLFVAGGIGITLFLSMLKGILERGEERDVVLLMSKVLLNLVAEAISPPSSKLKLVVHVFSSQEIPGLNTSRAELKKHSSRISQNFWVNCLEDVDEREVYLCGPPEFDGAIQERLGLEVDRIHFEAFNY